MIPAVEYIQATSVRTIWIACLAVLVSHDLFSTFR